MASIGEIGRWIADNESLFSGLAALVVLAGVVLSPLGAGLRRFRAREKKSPPPPALPVAGPAVVPGAAEAPAAVEPAHTDPVLAVLAFDNLSSDPEMQFFSDGVSEEIIQRMARVDKLRVIGRTTSFQFRGDRKAVAGDQLHCSHVLDGSIRRGGGQVRISAHLVDVASGTTLWADHYDGPLDDIFVVQDGIAANIARALDRTFFGPVSPAVPPAIYDRYLAARPSSYAPDELRSCVGQLEQVTRSAPDFAEAWGRLACLRAWLHFYQPFAERPALAQRVNDEAMHALAGDPHNVDALTAQLFVIPPFGCFIEGERAVERLRRVPGSGHAGIYTGWYLRSLGFVREGLAETERSYRLDSLDPMASNLLALARMAAGDVAGAVPVFEELVERIPDMSFPVSSLLRAYALLEDWPSVDRLLALAEQRQLREFQEGLAFIRARREPTPEHVGRWLDTLASRVATSGRVDVSSLVYAAHLGLTEQAYRLADSARLGPAGTSDDVMGPDGYRTALLFQAGMPELRNDPRFAPLCARLGLVALWVGTGRWPDCAAEVPYDFKRACEEAQQVPKEACRP